MFESLIVKNIENKFQQKLVSFNKFGAEVQKKGVKGSVHYISVEYKDVQ